MPTRISLLEPGVQGERLELTGRVLKMTGEPVPDVRLEFWQADAAGRYDMAGNKLRGIQPTAASGGFLLETIMPGNHDGVRIASYDIIVDDC